MKSITLLLIPLLFFMTGCSIDWNDEKRKVLQIPTQSGVAQYQSLSGTQDDQDLSGSEQNGSGIEYTSGITITDFGSGFTLSQTEDETQLNYSGKVIKTWSHIPPEKVPFVWDEACEILWKKFKKLPVNDQSNQKQGVWDELTIPEKKYCMKQYFGNGSIYIKEDTNIRFIIITESYYEKAEQFIFDKKTQNIQQIEGMLIDYILDSPLDIKVSLGGNKKIRILTPDFTQEISQ